MPKELGSNQSAGLRTVWKKENQINGIYEKKKRQRNKPILKGILCSCQKSLDRERARQTISVGT